MAVNHQHFSLRNMLQIPLSPGCFKEEERIRERLAQLILFLLEQSSALAAGSRGSARRIYIYSLPRGPICGAAAQNRNEPDAVYCWLHRLRGCGRTASASPGCGGKLWEQQCGSQQGPQCPAPLSPAVALGFAPRSPGRIAQSCPGHGASPHPRALLAACTQLRPTAGPTSFCRSHRTIESLRLEKTSKITKSNHQPNTPTPAKP